MADDINTLLGLGLTSQDDMKALANSLRKEQAIGDYFSTSTTPEWAKYGQGIQSRTQNAAKTGGVLKQAMDREAARKQELAAKNQQAQENYESTALAKTMAAKELARTNAATADTLNQNKIASADLLNQNKVAAAEQLATVNQEKAEQLAADKAAAAKAAADLAYEDFELYVDANGNEENIVQRGGHVFTHDADGKIIPTTLHGKKKYVDPNKNKSRGSAGSLTKKERGDFEGGVAEGLEALRVLDGYEKDYSVSETLGMDVDGTPLNALDNWAAGKFGVGSERDKKKAKWWRTLQRFVELPQRHALFGSALTATEAAAWEKAAVAESLDAEQAEALVKELTAIINERIRKAAGNSLLKGADEEYVRFNTDGKFSNMDSINKVKPYGETSPIPITSSSPTITIRKKT